MTAPEFYNLVAQLRDEQKRWYAGHKTQTQLVLCKRLEAKVDEALAERKMAVGNQAKLF